MARSTIRYINRLIKALRKGAFLLMFVGMLTLLVGNIAYAAEAQAPAHTVYVAGSGNAALDRHLMSLLQEQVGETVSLTTLSNSQAALLKNTPIVTIGPSAFTRARQASRSAPILAMMVDKNFISSFAARSPGQITSVFYDVPLLRQALIGKVILPHATRVALLATAESVKLYEPLIDKLPNYNIQAKVFVVENKENLFSTLTRALGYGDFLLAAPDDAIYNPRTIKHILLTAYRRNKIVIGPSQAYVRAGALASGYAPFPAMMEMAAQYINEYVATGEFPAPAYPKKFRAEVNRQVARSLNIPLPDNKEISKAVQRLLREHGGQGVD